GRAEKVSQTVTDGTASDDDGRAFNRGKIPIVSGSVRPLTILDGGALPPPGLWVDRHPSHTVLPVPPFPHLTSALASLPSWRSRPGPPHSKSGPPRVREISEAEFQVVRRPAVSLRQSRRDTW